MAKTNAGLAAQAASISRTRFRRNDISTTCNKRMTIGTPNCISGRHVPVFLSSTGHAGVIEMPRRSVKRSLEKSRKYDAEMTENPVFIGIFVFMAVTDAARCKKTDREELIFIEYQSDR